MAVARPVQYEPLSRRPVPDVIAERITAMIEAGSLSPGDRLPSESELARQFGVGRSSLREAVRKLHTLRVVEVINGRGIYILNPPDNDPTLRFLRWSEKEGFAVAEVLEARIGLETTAAGLACLRATDDELETLVHRSGVHEAAHLSGDVSELVDTDQRFHESLIRASHNDVLHQLYAPLVSRLTEFRTHTLSLAGAPERSGRDHNAIVAAIKDKDAGSARRAVVQHLGTLYEEVSIAGHAVNAEEHRLSALLEVMT